MNKKEIIKRLYNDYVSKFIFKIILAGIFSILVAASTSATAWLLDPAIEKIFLDKDKTLIFLIPLAIIIAFSTKGIALYKARMIMIKISEEVKKMLQIDMLRSFINADTEIIESKHTGKYISNVMFDTHHVQNLVSVGVLNLMKDSFSVIALVSLMFYQNWKLAIFAILMIPLAGGLAKSLGKRVGKATSKAGVSSVAPKASDIPPKDTVEFNKEVLAILVSVFSLIFIPSDKMLVFSIGLALIFLFSLKSKIERKHE